MSRLMSLLAALAVFVLTVPAFAGGFGFPGNGTKSAARGGAYMLSVTGPEALQFNPAALSRLDGHQVTLNSNLHFFSAEFDRAGNATYSEKPSYDGDPIDNEPVETEFGAFPAPSLYLSSDLGLNDFAIAIGAYGPNAVGHRKWPKDGPQRFLLIESEVLEIYYSLGAGYHWNGLRIGGVFQMAHMLAKFQTVTSSALGTPDENPKDDAVTSLDVTDLKPTGQLALSYDVNRSLSFGAVYKFGIKFVAEGTVETEFNPEGTAAQANARLADDKAKFHVNEPDTLRLAARYAHLDGEREIFDVELVFGYERWSVLDEFKIETPGPIILELGGEVEIPLKTTTIQHQWEDTYSLRLGGDINLDEMLSVRLGGWYETAASKSAYSNLDFIAHDRYGLGLGATVYAGDFDIDFGYMAVFYADRNVDDGALPVLSPLLDDQSNNPIVNNGEYSAFNHVASIGFTYRYDGARNAYTPRVSGNTASTEE